MSVGIGRRDKEKKISKNRSNLGTPKIRKLNLIKAKAECSVGRVAAVPEGALQEQYSQSSTSAGSQKPKSSWIDFFLKPFPVRMKQWYDFKSLSKDFSGKKLKKSLLWKRMLGEKC